MVKQIVNQYVTVTFWSQYSIGFLFIPNPPSLFFALLQISECSPSVCSVRRVPIKARQQQTPKALCKYKLNETMDLRRHITFNAGHGNVFCCKTFTAMVQRAPNDTTPPPSPRMLSYLDRLVTCANTCDLSGPPRRDHQKDVATLNDAKFLVKMYTIDTHPSVLIVYFAPSDLKREWGSMVELCRGKFSFMEQFYEYASVFEGIENLDAELRCAQHGARWYAEIYRRKETVA
ncbi:hypothetical protein N431DRAFT_365232 [Stipitochalara longipes BDJ]|nr:hypothetical protein N431DRAFT_365232 [Stipitochalara longipes BDJ]